jgi:hypothetical protein
MKGLKLDSLQVGRKTGRQLRTILIKVNVPSRWIDSAIHGDCHRQHADMPNFPFPFPGNISHTPNRHKR